MKAQQAYHFALGFRSSLRGSLQLTTLSDGYFETSLADVIRNLPIEQADALQKRAHRGTPTRINHNMYLVQRPGERPTLIDAGMGGNWGPTMGHLPLALASLGLSPQDIGTVLLTHLHPDHSAGLIDLRGEALFPEAEIVIHEKEAAFWLDDANVAHATPGQEEWFDGARRAIAPYRGRTRLISTGEVVPGLTAVPLPGHTPGHTGYRLDDGSQSVLIWGDIVHLPQIQLPQPRAGVVFDVDIHEAAQTRIRIFDQAAADGMAIAGMHTEFPGVGYIERDRTGYRFVSELWLPRLPPAWPI